MSSVLQSDVAPLRRTDSEPATSLLVAIPFYRGERLVGRMVQSLVECADELRSLKAHVVLFNDSPDYAPLAAALDEAVALIGSAFGASIHTNPLNLGWLKTCNLAMRQAVDLGADILLLNSDTIVFRGALTEMLKASRKDPMIGFVNPRSNNATLASLPVGERFERMAPKEAEAAYRMAARTLPDVTYVPTAVGFALLIRRGIILEFGFFDEIYGHGYNEENDLVMRASRCGFRAVLANRAFVWHEGEQSLGGGASSKEAVEQANRAILVSRYPEYPKLVDYWFQGVEHTTERLLSTLVPGPDGRLQIAFDFSTFGPTHSGTQKAGVQLLKAAREWSARWDIFVLCNEETYDFHGIADLGVERRDPYGPEKFAAIFRIGQPFDWDPVRLLALKGAIIGVFMLDTIAQDCSHLYSPFQFDMWQHVLKHADFIVYNSEFTARQFKARFAHAGDRGRVVSMHSLDLDDYQAADTGVAPSPEIEALGGGYVLVIGNQYPHKAVAETANRIAKAYPDLSVVALGATKEKTRMHGAPTGTRAPFDPADLLADLPNLTGIHVGGLPQSDMDALQRNALLIVVPSHYEGFGFPIPGALGLRRPIAVRPLPPHLEIHARLGRNPNVHFFETTADLLGLLEDPPEWRETAEQPKLAGDARRAANDIRDLIEHTVKSANYTTISERFRSMHTLYGAAYYLNRKPHPSPSDAAAQLVGDGVTRAFSWLFRSRTVYGASRMAYRSARFLLGRKRPPETRPE
jgi:GT2 family glycosyltransferase